MSTVGSGIHTYEMVENWGSLPAGWTFGPVSAVAVDSRDRVYAFQRKDPPVLVFDREGNYLNSWGSSAITDPHGIYIGPDDVIYLTDRDDHVAVKFALEAVNRGCEMTQAEGEFLEATLFGLCCATADMKEGTRAFIEKRPAKFVGR